MGSEGLCLLELPNSLLGRRFPTGPLRESTREPRVIIPVSLTQWGRVLGSRSKGRQGDSTSEPRWVKILTDGPTKIFRLGVLLLFLVNPRGLKSSHTYQEFIPSVSFTRNPCSTAEEKDPSFYWKHRF